MVKKLVRITQQDLLGRREFLKRVGAIGIALSLEVPMFGCGKDPPSEDEPKRVEWQGPDVLPAGTPATWTCVYLVGERGFGPDDSLAICVEHGTDWGLERNPDGLHMNRFGGLSVLADRPCEFEIKRDQIRAAGNLAELVLISGQLEPGDEIRIVIGDPNGQPEGARLIAPTIAHEATIRVLEHVGGRRTDDDFLLYEEVSPSLKLTVLPLEAAALSVLAKSHAGVGEPLSLLLRIEDRHGNIVTDFSGVVNVYDDTSDRLLWSGSFTPADQGLVWVPDVLLDRAGVYRIRAEVPALDLLAYGGPIEVGSDPGRPPVRWGQIHGHSLVSDGLGSAEEWYRYARDRSNLDFAALTDHGYLTEIALNLIDGQFFRHYIPEDVWDEYTAVTRSMNEPGRFVTFLAYEWTSNIASDKNVYFLHDSEPWQEYPQNVEELYARYRDRADQVTIMSHMMWAVPFMRATDWELFDPDLERLVEVASVHGFREYAGNPYWTDSDIWAQENKDEMRGHLVADGLACGHRLGLVCGSDCHNGFPGNSHPGRFPCRCDGSMATRTSELSRDAIWANWRSRYAYGTTGPRVLLDFFVNGSKMGEVCSGAGDQPRRLVVRAYAPRPITRIEIVRGDPEVPIHTVRYTDPVWNPPELEWQDEEPLDEPTFYYIRLFLDDEHIAWSSPIWLELV